MGSCARSDQSDPDKLIGTWKIVSIVSEVIDPGGRTTSHPANWHGYITLTAAHRVIVIQTARGRPIPETDDEYIYAYCSMIAYSGRFRVDANKIIISVDIAWNEDWNGTEQIWFYRFDNDRLIIEDQPKAYQDIPGHMIRVIWTCNSNDLGIN